MADVWKVRRGRNGLKLLIECDVLIQFSSEMATRISMMFMLPATRRGNLGAHVLVNVAFLMLQQRKQ
jgi:hypothetical protein